MSRTIIELEDIFKRFYIGTPNELEVLHGISLKVMEGEFVAIVGAIRLRKVNTDEHYRCARPTDRRQIHFGWCGHDCGKGCRTFQDPQPQDRFCFPDIQSDL